MFSEKDYEWLKVIECLKSSGLSIKEIRAFIDMAARGDESIHERLELFQSRRTAVKKQMEDLQATLDLLEFKCWYYEQAVKDGTEANVKALTADQLPEPYRTTKEKMSMNKGI